MDEDLKRILTKDLIYEIETLERAFLVVTSDELASFRATQALANLFIESFWMHARNLTEFFETPRESSTVSPLEFTNITYRKPETQKHVRDLVNAQITHLQKDRRESDKLKLAVQMQNVLRAIQKAVAEFETSLSEGSRKCWPKYRPMTVADVIAHFANGAVLLKIEHDNTCPAIRDRLFADHGSWWPSTLIIQSCRPRRPRDHALKLLSL